jgi:Tfp pilus assembly protein FimT
MVVLILIGILTAMILPEMSGTYADARLRSAGRDLVNVFKLAYSQAVSRNQIHAVRFDPKGSHFSLERQVHGRGNQIEFAELKGVSGGSGDIDNRIKVIVRKTNDPSTDSPETSALTSEAGRPPDNALTFYPDGTADGAEVLLRDLDGFGLRLRIDPITARVEIFELERE